MSSPQVLLHNNSPVATDFLAVLDSEAGGSEHGVDMSEGLALACTPGGRGQGCWREQGHPPSSEAMIHVIPTQVRSVNDYFPYDVELMHRTRNPFLHVSVIHSILAITEPQGESNRPIQAYMYVCKELVLWFDIHVVSSHALKTAIFL